VSERGKLKTIVGAPPNPGKSIKPSEYLMTLKPTAYVINKGTLSKYAYWNAD
jgi:hypothetical protein